MKTTRVQRRRQSQCGRADLRALFLPGATAGLNVASFVSEHTFTPEAGPTWVAFPAPSASLLLGPLHAQAGVLLRLANGSLWFADLKGQVWTTQRVQQLAVELATLACTMPTVALQRTLRKRLELPSLALGHPDPYAEPAQVWDTAAVALALYQRASVGSASDRGDCRATAVEAALSAALHTARARMSTALDREALQVASNGGFRAATYNFLAEAGAQCNRRQFAQVFPALLPWIARHRLEPAARNLVAAIDTGVPLVKFIAAEVDVSPSAVRCLFGVQPEWLGARWIDRPLEVLRELNELAPEHRPLGSLEAWRHYTQISEDCDRDAQALGDASAVALGWMRRRMRTVATSGKAPRPLLLDPAVLRAIQQLRQALIRTIMRELEVAQCAGCSMLSAGTIETVDEALAEMSHESAAVLALRWQAMLDKAREFAADQADLEAGRKFWPLTARPYACPEHGLRIEPLTTRAAFVGVGSALRLCLATPLARTYEIACREQAAFLVALVDVRTGRAASVAEVRVSSSGRQRVADARLAQHSGAANGTPPPACQAAMADLMGFLKTSAAQTHIWRGRECLAQARENESAGCDQQEHRTNLSALRDTMGDQRLEHLIQRATARVLS